MNSFVGYIFGFKALMEWLWIPQKNLTLLVILYLIGDFAERIQKRIFSIKQKGIYPSQFG